MRLPSLHDYVRRKNYATLYNTYQYALRMPFGMAHACMTNSMAANRLNINAIQIICIASLYLFFIHT